MKIQFGDKGEVSWDVLLEALDKEQYLDQRHQQENCCRKCLRNFQYRCCGGSWLSLVFVVSVVICSQAFLFLYLLSTWGAFYTPAGHLVYNDTLGKLHHVHFSWSNCGDSLDPIQLKQLRVSPDPVPLNGNITLDLNCLVTETANAPISADFEVERRIFWLWVKIPCLDGLGSCHYNDVCKVIPFPPSEPCPDPFPRFKLPCRCPALKGHYIVKNSTFSVPGIVSYLPSWLISGDYYVHGVAYKNSTRLGCYSVYASVSY